MPSLDSCRFCSDEDLARIGYDGLHARKDLDAWLRDGPNPASRELIDVLCSQPIEGAAVLDIGAGVGAVHLSLLEHGAASAVDVDASREYIATAREEAERRGLASRVTYRYGDVVELAAELPPVDVVTLDSVICCYPRLQPLIQAALRSRPRVVGLTYPRDVWWMRAYMRVYNVAHALRRSPSRYFIHRRASLHRLMADAGYERLHEGGLPIWTVVVFRRSADAARGAVDGNHKP